LNDISISISILTIQSIFSSNLYDKCTSMATRLFKTGSIIRD
jgi:hypothetical protein